MKSYILIKWSCDWADEFNTDGFILTTKDKWEEYVSKLPTNIGHMYFGTNEGWDDMSREDYLHSCKTQPVSDGDAKCLFKLFKNDCSTFQDAKSIQYGIFPLCDGTLDEDDEFDFTPIVGD